ncbi:MAG: PIN domain-containing protein [Candidatus Humimicrobiaceae bacterium]
MWFMKTWSQIKLLGNIYDQSSGRAIYVPDTNALLANPRIEQWRFAGVSEFEIILTPTVLSELDKLKINHRVEVVREKAEGLIRQIKGYRARGKLNDGVPLTSGISTLKSIAVEPNFNQTLSWLDPSNDDDRILASFIEVMKIYPNSPVIIITNDINMQNKAEFAGIPFIEPPD